MATLKNYCPVVRGCPVAVACFTRTADARCRAHGAGTDRRGEGKRAAASTSGGGLRHPAGRSSPVVPACSQGGASRGDRLAPFRLAADGIAWLSAVRLPPVIR